MGYSGSGGFIVSDVLEQLFTFPIELLGGLVIGHGMGQSIPCSEAQAGPQSVGGVRDRLETLVRRIHVLIAIAPPLAALVVEVVSGKKHGRWSLR